MAQLNASSFFQVGAKARLNKKKEKKIMLLESKKLSHALLKIDISGNFSGDALPLPHSLSTHVYTHTPTRTHTHACTHTRTHSPMHTHIHTYTHMLHAHKHSNVKILSHSDAQFVPKLFPSPCTKSCCHKISSFHQNDAHLPNLYWTIWFLVMRVTQATFACFHLITLSVDTPTDTHSHKHSYMFTPTCAY